jgi:UDP-glucose 4-epimerase
MTILIAGGAGFIGSNLVNLMSDKSDQIIVIDNLSKGSVDFIPQVKHKKFHFYNFNLSKSEECFEAFSIANNISPVTEVWHLAANSDIPAGVENIDVDHKDTFMTTLEILRAMKHFKVKKIFFASSSAIYGDLGDAELHENIGPLLPISNYGAMKLASEALISAAAESYLDRAAIFRFPNVVGVPATHGVIYDFINRLKINPNRLDVLGNGLQQKAYLHVTDLISAMLLIRDKNDLSKVDVTNIGPVDKGVTVSWIAKQVVDRVSSGAEIVFGTSDRGWVGDVPKFNYSTHKLQSYGWSPLMGSESAIIRAVDEIATQLGF